MDPDKHRIWLTELAIETQRRRAEAEPELARKEARLRAELTKLDQTKVALETLEEELEQQRQQEDAPDGG